MKIATLVPYYFVWHYTLALKNLIKIWGNFVWFVYNYFSFKVLLRTLFSPYKRLTERYHGGLDIEQLMESIVVNALMRLIGFSIRIVVLLIGAIGVVLTFVAGTIFLAIWFLLPFVLLFMFIAGIVSVVLNQELKL